MNHWFEKYLEMSRRHKHIVADMEDLHDEIYRIRRNKVAWFLLGGVMGLVMATVMYSYYASSQAVPEAPINDDHAVIYEQPPYGEFPRMVRVRPD